MEKLRLWVVVLSVVVAVSCCCCCCCKAIESPQYVVVHLESDFEIRFYRESTWMSAPVNELSFEKATMLGFHRLFQFIEGANLNYSRIPMTAPVVTSIVPGAGPFHSSAYSVRLYLPVKFEDDPPVPLPELNLKPYKWKSRCVAVRKFYGFARDDRIVKQAEKLAFSLSRSPWATAISDESSYGYSIAQYDSPFIVIGRTNEVWADVKASGVDDCNVTQVASY